MKLKENQKINVLGSMKKVVEVSEFENDDFFGNSIIYDLSDGSQLMYDSDSNSWSLMLKEGEEFRIYDISYKDKKFVD